MFLHCSHLLEDIRGLGQTYSSVDLDRRGANQLDPWAGGEENIEMTCSSHRQSDSQETIGVVSPRFIGETTEGRKLISEVIWQEVKAPPLAVGDVRLSFWLLGWSLPLSSLETQAAQ